MQKYMKLIRIQYPGIYYFKTPEHLNIIDRD